MDTQPAAPMATPSSDPFLKKWNWGAFLLSWVWAFGHGLAMWGVIALVGSFIPVVGGLVAFGVAVYLGMKGSELAWETGKYANVDVLRDTEKKWTKWAIIVLCVALVLSVLAVVGVLLMAGGVATTSSTTQFSMFL